MKFIKEKLLRLTIYYKDFSQSETPNFGVIRGLLGILAQNTLKLKSGPNYPMELYTTPGELEWCVSPRHQYKILLNYERVPENDTSWLQTEIKRADKLSTTPILTSLNA